MKNVCNGAQSREFEFFWAYLKKIEVIFSNYYSSTWTLTEKSSDSGLCFCGVYIDSKLS